MPRAYKCRGCGIEKPSLEQLHDPITRRCRNCGGFWNARNVNVVDEEDGETSKLIEGESISLQDAIRIADRQPEIQKIETGIEGVDHVLGGGVVPGSLILLTASPGCGKSTLLIQIFQALARRRQKCLYVTGEESVAQLAYRYKRLGKFPTRMQALHATDLDHIFDQIIDVNPNIVGIDSIQCVEIDDHLDVGSPTSIKVSINELRKFAKEEGVAVFVIGHVTKGGAIGGPRALEHLVDVAIHLYGNKDDSRRVLKCESKNRFAKTGTESFFVMSDEGLKEVQKPEAIATQNVVELKSVPLDNGNRPENS